MKPGELASIVHTDLGSLRYRMKPLIESGAVTVTGNTTQRVIALGTSAKGKNRIAAPAVVTKPNGGMRPAKAGHYVPSSPSSTLDHVELLDDTLLLNLKGAGRVGRSVRELSISHPNEAESALVRSLTRLKVKQKVQVDDNGRWTAA